MKDNAVGNVTVYVVLQEGVKPRDIINDMDVLCFVETQDLAETVMKRRRGRSWVCHRLFRIGDKFYKKPDKEVRVYRELPDEKEIMDVLRQRARDKLTILEEELLGLAPTEIADDNPLGRFRFEDEKNP